MGSPYADEAKCTSHSLGAPPCTSAAELSCPTRLQNTCCLYCLVHWQVKFSWTMGLILYELLYPRPPQPPSSLPLFLGCFVSSTAFLLAALVFAHCRRTSPGSYHRVMRTAAEAAAAAEEGRGEEEEEAGGFRFRNERGDDGWEWGEGGEGVGRLEEEQDDSEGPGPLEQFRHSLLGRLPSAGRLAGRLPSAGRTAADQPEEPARAGLGAAILRAHSRSGSEVRPGPCAHGEFGK
jgi:hypothetical protein